MKTRSFCVLALLLLGALGATSCASKRTPAQAKAPATDDAALTTPLSRELFNRRAAHENLPLFWRTDANGNGRMEADELVVLWGISNAPRSEWLNDQGVFTPKLVETYRRLVTEPDLSKLEPTERRRREKVREELDQGRPTLIESDFRTASAEDRALVKHVLRAAEWVEKIHAQQAGTYGLDAKIPQDDPASRMLFFRNQGPHCVAPKTEGDPDCHALPERPKRQSGLYPPELQQADPKFCDALSKRPNAQALMGHFSVVTADGKGGYQAVPYTVAYKEEMEAVASELEQAAAAITSPSESALKAYLTAAARAFRTNDWEPANEAWAAMDAQNSAWYLRIAPDEVYFEPCAWKAGFAVAFARINKDSLAWQAKLGPVKGEMEKALAALAGPPYKARDVKFKLPDFIDIVLNAGDARPPHGATIGQSLPNWGKVAERGGRTVAMTNLYTDADSLQTLTEQMASLYCPATMEKASADPKVGLMSTVLHEAAHNLGPSHEYKVKGKVDDELFGGPLASTLEELKAQTAALYFSDWLADRQLITAAEAERSHVRDVAWGFGHVSRGMYTPDGTPKNYSHLASIQLGHLRKAGALTWEAEKMAANGKDKGCFELHLERWRPAVKELATTVFGIKGRGDKARALALKAEHVDAQDEWAKLREIITQRWTRAPKASFVYAVTP